jgi:hypothetical protein
VTLSGPPSTVDPDAATLRPPTASPLVALPVAPGKALLLHSLRDPLSLSRRDAASLDDIVHAARQHAVLGRLERDLAALGVLDGLPETARRQFANARVAADTNAVALRYEIDRVRRALAGLDTRIVLLKGAAYLHAGLPLARGRVSVDLDILVPAADIGRVEQTLTGKGWQPKATDRYDQHYYRDWMHEIPPLVHSARELELDVHHTIFPPVSGIKVDADALLAAAVPLDDGLFVLSPADMVLHAATHLFQEDPSGRLRDLLDLHDLLTLFGRRAGFWDGLIERARHHGLGRPLYYGMRTAADLTLTDVPPAVLARTEAAFAPNAPQRWAMAWLMHAAIIGAAPGRSEPGTTVAQWLLFARSHWVKMPPTVLLGHAVAKLVRRARERLAR